MADVSGLILTVLGLSFNVASMLYTYAKDVRDARGDIQRLSNELFALTGVLQHMKIQQERAPGLDVVDLSLIEESNGSIVREVLQECIEFLQDIHQKLAIPKNRLQAKIQKMRWPFQDNEMRQHLARLERVKTYFMLALMSDDLDATRQIASQISDLRSLVLADNQERQNQEARTKYRKVMEWLSPVDPRQSYERILKSRTPGSGAWLTDSKDFLTWRESATNSVFWLNGITGAGKTTLMTTAIENVVAVDSKQCRTAYLYCSFANSETLEVGNILGSILAQLCNDDDTVYHKSVSLYDDRLGDKMERPIPLDVNVLVKLIAEQIQSIGNVYVFVDAINECGDVYEIAASFDTILKSLNTAKNSLRQMPHLIIKTLSPRAIWNDVHLYVEANLEAHPRLRHYDPQLKAEIRRTLTGRAEGMFRYVYCQLDLLSRLRTPGAVKEALTSLPPTLDQTYERLLMRIDGEEDMRLSREILEILCFCFRPLQLKELCEFLQITPGLPMLDESKRLTDPSDVLGICGSFLNYQEDRDVVALAHHSVKTYLLSDLPPSVRYFRISKIEAHRSLAIKCLAYLSLDEFSSGPFAKLGERLRRYPLYKYAGDCWTMHSRALEQGGQQELGEPLWQVLRPFLFSAEHGRGNFLAWAQLLAPWSKNISRTGPLYYAASFGLTTVVRYLLEAGADMEAPGGRGGATPLNIASFRGRTDVVKLLLEYGADPEAADEEVGWNALEWAEAKNHWDVVVLLNRHEANKRHVDGDGNEDGSGIMSKMIQSDRRHLVTSTRNDYQD